jgi:DNA-binding HxlR family transcriptional regulator
VCSAPGDFDRRVAPPEASPGRAGRALPRARTPIEITSTLVRGRWTVPILWSLFWGGKRFYRLLRDITGISRTILEKELQGLEELALVEKQLRREGVEYRLSPLGESLKPLLATMYQWGLFARHLPVAERLVPTRRASDPQAERSRPAD